MTQDLKPSRGQNGKHFDSIVHLYYRDKSILPFPRLISFSLGRTQYGAVLLR